MAKTKPQRGGKKISKFSVLRHPANRKVILSLAVGLAVVGVGLAVYLALAQPTSRWYCPSNPTLKQGANDSSRSDQCVHYLQDALAKAGKNPGTVDGIFGPKTRAAVARFQGTADSTKVTVGPLTWQKVRAGLASAPAKTASKLTPQSGSQSTARPSGSAQSLARQVLNHGNISLNNGARQNLQRVANGGFAQTSCGQTGVPCKTKLNLNPNMLRCLLIIAGQTRVYVSYLTDGLHGSSSQHYSGDAVDIGQSGSNLRKVADVAYANRGACKIDDLIYSPYSNTLNAGKKHTFSADIRNGHRNHVHISSF